ncbi:hypothetical protein NHX12_023700 [Muraenolepis orangiensis]|uniref:Anillin n=1 Tax=Muraenolepis orangiensis TaxID=630683 RepID=A0A9Q0IU24_9TELE|nr:hypothetical protein NHX12_023700 [Muraenolepis orangiensis]
MDPFTQKLLERTRARRENLQKKIAERPNAANRQMTKRAREPLAETNRTLPEPVIDEAALHPSAKPSPSKRRCSEENPQPSSTVVGEEAENWEPVAAPPPALQDPPTDRKPPTGPTFRLAAKRNYWDNDTSDDVPLSPVKSSWEDDLSHPTIPNDNPPVKPPSSFMSRVTPKQSAVPSNQMSTSSKPLPCSAQSVQSPVKSIKVVPASPQKSGAQTVTPAGFQAGRASALSSPVASPNKGLNKSTASQSPLKSQGLSKRLDLNTGNTSPSKLDLPAKPARSDPSIPSRERLGVVAKDSSTPQQQKATPGTPVGVKSFLERFGERCQERATHQGTPTGTGGTQAKNPGVGTPTGTGGTQAKNPGVTPNTRLVQEKLRSAQAASTTSSDLTQRQKLERETELALIRNRFQKSDNMWKNKDEATDGKKNADAKAPARQLTECVMAKSQPKDELPAVCVQSSTTLTGGIGLLVSSPVSTSSPLRRVERPVSEDHHHLDQEKSEEEVEMNVDSASINSAVINELFECTAASVIRSPERNGMMTSTPAGSFIEKSDTTANSSSSSTPGKFQRARVSRAGSSPEASEGNHKLLYSVDAYRSIRVKETERPHVKQVIVRKEDVSLRVAAAAAPRSSGQDVGIKQRIKALTSDMNLQQSVIHQASQALNCCTDEEHGKGSPVEAEAQRLLLVATEKRLALKAELDRLKGEGPKKGAAGPSRPPLDMGFPASKGSITLQELRLPLKADFVCTANKPESSSHYFFILIRAGAENMVATPLVSTRSALSGDALSFKTTFTMSEVSNDFEVDIQVYCLVMKREGNDKKKKLNKSKAMTPKRFLAITKSSQTPVMASPGGPNAVRTSCFVLVGSHKLTLSSVGKNKFPLDKVPFLCPLEGHIYLKMQCQVGSSRVEERGFLTMFEDVSGFGAWHRRWCVLSGYCISYWTYPDDERRKNPIGRINLANCTSRRVEPANREFCARPNTLELITVRPQRDDDRETLVSQCQNTMCVTKNWLSADTKDERNLWMQKLNQILVDLRMWQPDSCLTPP